MALIHSESFTLGIQSDYIQVKGYSSFSLGGSSGATPAYTGAPNMFINSITWPVPTAAARFYTSERIRIPGANQGSGIMYCSDGSGNILLSVRVDSSGNLIATQGGANTLLQNSGYVITDSAWHFVEVDWNIGGHLICNVDGVQKLNVAHTATGNIASVSWVELLGGSDGGGGILAGTSAGDMYVLDTNTPNNSFLGDVHVEGRRASGAGALTQWTPNTAAANYQEVVDGGSGHPPDYATTYVATAGVGNRDYYTLPNIVEAAPTAIYAVCNYVCAEKDNTASRGIKASLRSSTTQLDGSELVLTNGSWTPAKVFAQVDPATGSSWTVSAANAVQAGILLSS